VPGLVRNLRRHRNDPVRGGDDAEIRGVGGGSRRVLHLSADVEREPDVPGVRSGRGSRCRPGVGVLTLEAAIEHQGDAEHHDEEQAQIPVHWALAAIRTAAAGCRGTRDPFPCRVAGHDRATPYRLARGPSASRAPATTGASPESRRSARRTLARSNLTPSARATTGSSREPGPLADREANRNAERWCAASIL